MYVLSDGSESGAAATGDVITAASDIGAAALGSTVAALGTCIAVQNNLNTHTQATILNEFRTAILHANGHNGNITCSAAASVADGAQTLTLTQATSGTAGNVTVTTNGNVGNGIALTQRQGRAGPGRACVCVCVWGGTLWH